MQAPSVSYLRTKTELVASVRNRLGFNNDSFATDAEIEEYLKEECGKYFSLLLETYGKDFMRLVATIPTVLNQATYALPADFDSLLSLTVEWSAGNWQKLIPLADGDVDVLLTQNGYAASWPVRYRLGGSNLDTAGKVAAGTADVLELWPTPKGVYNVRVEYVPTLSFVQAPASDWRVDFRRPGFDVFVTAGVCVTLLAKEESDPSIFLAQQQKAEALIRSGAPKRNGHGPMRTVDTQRSQGADARQRWWPPRWGRTG